MSRVFLKTQRTRKDYAALAGLEGAATEVGRFEFHEETYDVYAVLTDLGWQMHAVLPPLRDGWDIPSSFIGMLNMRDRIRLHKVFNYCYAGESQVARIDTNADGTRSLRALALNEVPPELAAEFLSLNE